MTRAALANRAGVALALLLLAFAFLGTRGLWEPDEGRYVGAASEMVHTGEWLVPHLHGAPHLTKPPLTYWAIGAGLLGFGLDEWGARLYLALAFLTTAGLVARLARRLLGPGHGALAALIFGTSLLPFAAASTTTADALLGVFTTASVLAFWEARTAPSDRIARRFRLVLGVMLGLAFLTKGPPGLLQILPMAAFDLAHRDGRARRFAWARWEVLVAFLLVASPWFAHVLTRFPGLWRYLLIEEVVARVATDAFARNAEWYQAFEIYGIALLLGGVPWSLLWVRWAARSLLRARVPGTSWSGVVRELGDRPAALFLTLWIALPLLTLMLARSRMLLYALPLFPPLALVTAARLRAWLTQDPALAARRRARFAAAIAVWCVALIGLRALSAEIPSHRDARRMAEQLRALDDGGATEMLIVDERIHGLEFYLGLPTRSVRTRERDVPSFPPSTTLTAEIGASSTRRRIYVARPERAREIERALNLEGAGASFRPISERIAAVIVPAAPEQREPRLAVVAEPAQGDERDRVAAMLRAAHRRQQATHLIVVGKDGRAVRSTDESALARLVGLRESSDLLLAAPASRSVGAIPVVTQRLQLEGETRGLNVVWALPGATSADVARAADSGEPSYSVLVDETNGALDDGDGGELSGLFDACVSLREPAHGGEAPRVRLTPCRTPQATLLARAAGGAEVLVLDLAEQMGARPIDAEISDGRGRSSRK